ncbi:hypothetical protein HaLaN_15281 [Haematococcus lacustris]|uniref:Uncharacterized protein n=1 Tax=Haematococcus lacustris TaxID=44745 RepID=A0A699ZGC4_HAELA|nr:hypothetical protein HaLaN_15281 [Haematococcus lacustris]
MSPSTPTPGVEFVSWDVWHASRRRTLDVVWLSAVGSALAWHASAHARSWEHVACVAAFVMLLLAGSRTHLYCKVRPQTLAAIRLATVLFAYLCGTSKDAAGSDLCWSTVPVSHCEAENPGREGSASPPCNATEDGWGRGRIGCLVLLAHSKGCGQQTGCHARRWATLPHTSRQRSPRAEGTAAGSGHAHGWLDSRGGVM